MTYDELIDFNLGIGEANKPKDYWVAKNKIPTLMRNKFVKYENGKIPLKDTICIRVDKNNPFHMLIVGKTGRQKTRMVKNIIRGFYKAGYKIMIIEPKKMDMWYMSKPGNGVRLAQYDHNELKGLPVSCYTPVAYKEYCERVLKPSDFNRLKFYSISLKILDYPEMWQSFGIPEKGAQFIVNKIKNEKIYDIKRIIKDVRNARSDELYPSTRNAAAATLETLEGTNLFNRRYEPLPLQEEWDNNKIVILPFHNKQGKIMNTSIGLAVTCAKNIGQAETTISKKLIIFDDCFMYAGAMAYNFARGGSDYINYAQNEMANCQYNYRSFGIDSIVIVQNLDHASIHPTIVEGRDEFLITRTGSSDILRNIIPYSAYFLVTNQNPMKGRVLVSNKEDYYFQWIYSKEDEVVGIGYPFDCTVGHPTVGG